MLNEQLQSQIEQEAKAYAQKRHDDLAGKKHLHLKALLMYAHMDGANGIAEKLQAAEQWKKEASLLLDPLLEWGQAQKDMPLGVSITTEILRRAKLWQAAEAKADRYEKALKDFARQIKLHCNKMGIRSVVIQCIANRMEELDIAEALTPKTSDDDR